MYRERQELLFVQEARPEKMKKDAIENEYNRKALENDLTDRGLGETAELVEKYHLLSLKDLFTILGARENIRPYLQEIRTVFNKHKKKNAEDKNI